MQCAQVVYLAKGWNEHPSDPAGGACQEDPQPAHASRIRQSHEACLRRATAEDGTGSRGRETSDAPAAPKLPVAWRERNKAGRCQPSPRGKLGQAGWQPRRGWPAREGTLVDDELRNKYESLKTLLGDLGGVVIAYSGGADSSLLLKVAVDVLGPRALAITATSPTYPPKEVEEATRLARELGARHRIIGTDELETEAFANNPPERCYYCKTELFQKLVAIACEEGLPVVADGANVDDVGDYRPGLRAGAELGVRSPLREAGLGKDDVRAISRELGLPTWDKPSFACLASRFPYGDRITAENLKQVAAAEQVLRGLGFQQIRVRHHGDTARIEVDPAEFPAIIHPERRDRIVRAFRELGYLYVTLDLAGYRTGSMNEPLRAAGVSAADVSRPRPRT